MRPLHSALLALVLLFAFGVGAYLVASSSTGPEVASAAPGPSPSEPRDARAADLRGPDDPGESARGNARSASEVAPRAPELAPDSEGDLAAEGVQLGGLVLDPDGAPVAGARVLVSSGGGPGLGLLYEQGGLDARNLARSPWIDVRESRTDSSGRFSFNGLAPGGLKLAVRAAGFAPHDDDTLALPDEARHELAPVRLAPGAGVAGVVVDPGGKPVAGVEIVRLDGTGDQPHGGAVVARTGADGSFLVDVLEVGPWRLRVEPRDHPDAYLEGETSAPGERVQGLRVVLEAGLEIAGVVAGTPAELDRNLVVVANSQGPADEDNHLGGHFRDGSRPRRAKVAADGSFVLRGLRPGSRYALLVERQRSADMGFGSMFRTGLARTVFALAGERGVRIELEAESGLLFQVVDASSGQPIESYEVWGGIDWSAPLMDPAGGGRALREHPDGRARLGNLRPGSSDDRAKLRVVAQGYEPYEVDGLRLSAGLDTDLGQIALEPLPLATVTVLDAATGAPVAGARVRMGEVDLAAERDTGRRSIRMSFGASGDDGEDEGGLVIGGDLEERSATTNEAGVATLGVIAGRTCRFTVRSAEHAPFRGAPFPCPAGAFEREILLGRGGTVVANLMDVDGNPVIGGRVEHRGPADQGGAEPGPMGHGGEVTDADGQVTFEHLEPGEHRFRPYVDGSGVFRGNGMVVVHGGMEGDGDDWVSATVVEGGEAFVDLFAPLEVEVSGRVSEAGEPLAGARVSLVELRADPSPDIPSMMTMGLASSNLSAESDSRGEFSIAGVEPGEYTVSVSHPGRSMAHEEVITVGDSGREVDLDLPVSIVEGRVTNGAGEPLAGVRVHAERARLQVDGPRPVAIAVMAFSDGSGSSVVSLGGPGGGLGVETDAEGRYSLRGVLADAKLQVVAEGSAVAPTRSEPFEVAVNELLRDVDLVAEPAGSLRVEALRAGGAPGRNLLVLARFTGEDRDGLQPRTGFTDADGRARIEGLCEGPWRVSVQTIGPDSGDEEIPDQEVEIVAGEELVVSFDVP